MTAHKGVAPTQTGTGQVPKRGGEPPAHRRTHFPFVLFCGTLSKQR